MPHIQSRLPDTGTTIFTRMSALAGETGAINLSQGFPDFPPAEGLQEALAAAAGDAGAQQYAPMAGLPALRRAIAEHLLAPRGLAADPESEITVVPGATEGIFCAITASLGPGDEAILFDPAYDSYLPAVQLAGARAIRLPVTGTQAGPDWQRVEEAINPRTRMIVINSPHNPLGLVFTDDDLRELERLAVRHDLLICSDEVYEFLVFDGRRHHSVLSRPGLRERSFAHFSFGKTFSVTGWKTGYCVAPPDLTAELRRIHQYVAFVATTPLQQALATFIAREPGYPDTLARFYQRKRDLFLDALGGSRFTFTPSQGTYFQVLDYSAITDMPDAQLAERWTREIGVASIPISVFYEQPPWQHLLRFCFAKSDEVLLEAAKRLCEI
jgi:methionine aminotransferase